MFIPAAVIIPMCSIVWVCYLTEADGIFSFLSRWLIKAPVWVRNPLIDCVQCNTGQIAFWFFIIHYGLDLHVIPFTLVTIYISIFLPYGSEQNRFSK